MVHIQYHGYDWQPFTLVIDIYGSEWVEGFECDVTD